MEALKSLFALILLVAGCISIIFLGYSKKDFNNLKNRFYSVQCNCENVDDCLSKYKFVEARKFASRLETNEVRNFDDRGKAFCQISIAEANYWIDHGDMARAQSNIDEIMNSTSIDDEAKQKISWGLNKKMIIAFCKINRIKDARSLTKTLPEKTVVSHRLIWLENGGGYIEICRRQYYSIKGGLKANEEIEPFRGSCNSEGYTINVYAYPQSEALKIINEYSK